MELRRGLILFCVSAILSVIIAASYLLPLRGSEGPLLGVHTTGSTYRAPRENIWSELSKFEADEVYTFVKQQFPELKLVSRPKNTLENSIFTVETLRPNKTDAAKYLFEGEEAPGRWAKLVLSESFEDGPYLTYYAVGPLPISKNTRILPLEYPFTNGRNRVFNPIQDLGAVAIFGEQIGRDIEDITQKLLGATIDSDHPDGLIVLPRSARTPSKDGMTLWMQFFRKGLGSNARTLLPQGIYVKVNATGANPDEWRVGQYYYNGVLYENVEAFRAALDSPEFISTPANLDGPWTDTEDFDSTTPGRELPPPVVVQPYGPRYKLDQRQKFVSWFGFEFYISTAPATGLALFDIRFNGERVMYELGLEEAMAHYAGDDPMAGGQEFLDAFFGMGKNMFELVPGYDCPAYADYLSTQYHMAQEVHQQPNSICVFEYTADYLLSRHTAQYSVTASRNTFLTVRSVSTVGNYDYTIDYIFYMDGTLEVKVRASGFIFAAFHTANNTKNEDEYGHRIQYALSTSMHDHVINFKADLDVAGPSNDLVRLALEPITQSFPWDQPEAIERNTMHLVEYPVEEEIGLDWPKNGAEFFIAYSADEKNAWGERKGYRITPGTGMGTPPHLTIKNSTSLGDSARWAEHDVWAIRRKDTEPRSADPLNYLDPLDPLINFNHLANQESLDHRAADNDYDGDLVLYFNLGAHHVPHSGDVPNTLMHTSASSVMFVPHNFHDRDPSRASVQGVRLQLKGDKSGSFPGDIADPPHRDLRNRKNSRSVHKKPEAKYFGASYGESVQIPVEALEPNLHSYHSEMHEITHLTFNGSAAGIWFAD